MADPVVVEVPRFTRFVYPRERLEEPEVIGAISAFLGIWITIFPLEHIAAKWAIAFAFVFLIGAMLAAGAHQKAKAAAEAEKAREAERLLHQVTQSKIDKLEMKDSFAFIKGDLSESVIAHNTVNVGWELDERAVIVGETVPIRVLALSDGCLKNRRFQKCQMMGPAVLVPVRNVSISGNHFGGPPQSVVWAIPDKSIVIGAIGLVDCVFVECTFQNVAFAAPAEIVDDVRKGLSERK